VLAFLVPTAATLNINNGLIPNKSTKDSTTPMASVASAVTATQYTKYNSHKEPLEVPIYPWENVSIPSAVITTGDKLYIGTALHLYTTPSGKIEYEYIPLPSKISNDTFHLIIQNYVQDSSNAQSKYMNNEVTVSFVSPAYWERDSIIYIQVTFTKEFTWPPTTFHYKGYIKCYIKDKYLYEYGWNWVAEEAVSIYVDFTLTRPGESKTFNIPVQVGHTTVGLKKVVVTVPSLGISVDKGYIFVQKINVSEEIVKPLNPSNPNADPKDVLPYLIYDYHHIHREDPLGTTALHHPSIWYRLAAEAADAVRETDVNGGLGAIGRRIASWVNSHFNYSKIYNGTDLFSYSASDTWLINHRDKNGKFHGVCDEYSTLFVSFARAMNLPAREIGLGGKDLFNAPLAHATVEVWADNTWIHIELVEVVVYNPPLPWFYRFMFITIDKVYVFVNANELFPIDGLLSAKLDVDQNHEINFGIYEGPNNYKF